MRALLLTVLALAVPATASAAVDAVPGELIVKLRPGVSAKQRAAIGRPLGLPGTVLAHVPLRTNLGRAARDLERDPRVAWAQPNVYQRGAALPNDALYGQQWAPPAIDAPDAWNHTTGSKSVPVAIVDSGINYDEPDLAPNISPDLGWDYRLALLAVVPGLSFALAWAWVFGRLPTLAFAG